MKGSFPDIGSKLFILFICYREEKKDILDEFLKSEDFKEGIQSFLERRDADFKGV